MLSVLKTCDRPLRALIIARFMKINDDWQRIMEILRDRGAENVTVIEIELRKHQTHYSQILTFMREIGIVDYCKVGKEHYYFIVSPRWNQVKSAIKELAE